MRYVTFIIGNGFDINLGMNTRYSDVYNGYISTPSLNNNLATFKKDLQNDKYNNYELWSDFEMGMADYIHNFKSEQEFIECIRDFKAYMVQHLQNEQSSFSEPWVADPTILIQYANLLEHLVLNFYKGLIPNARNSVHEMLENETVTFNFITFNYTNILDRMITFYNNKVHQPKSPFIFNLPIHVHGLLFEDVVLGVDNESQLSDNLKFKLSQRCRRAFIKPIINNDYDSSRVELAQSIIAGSDVICTYGISFGESDKMWIQELTSWLLSSNSNHLVCNHYDTNYYPQFHGDLILEKEDEYKFELLKKMNLDAEDMMKAFKQLHIPVGKNIFDFSSLANKTALHSKLEAALR